MTQNNIAKYLVVGAGGTGSEIVKILCNRQSNLTILDYDIVEVSNLNRQFYYTENDRDKYKSKTISDKIGCRYEVGKIENVSDAFLDDFNVIFSCLDNVPSRMDLNYKFVNSKCPLLIDCGVESFEFRVKRVSSSDPCLYCVKDLYNVKNTPFLCSLKSTKEQITPENRERILNSLIFKIKGESNLSEFKDGTEFGSKIPVQAQIIETITFLFNKNAPDSLKTSVFEVQGLFNEILPNICTINSICASYAVDMAFNAGKHDFIHFTGSHKNLVQKIRLEKNTSCFVCEK